MHLTGTYHRRGHAGHAHPDRQLGRRRAAARWRSAAARSTSRHQYLDDNPTGTATDTYSITVTAHRRRQRHATSRAHQHHRQQRGADRAELPERCRHHQRERLDDGQRHVHGRRHPGHPHRGHHLGQRRGRTTTRPGGRRPHLQRQPHLPRRQPHAARPATSTRSASPSATTTCGSANTTRPSPSTTSHRRSGRPASRAPCSRTVPAH